MALKRGAIRPLGGIEVLALFETAQSSIHVASDVNSDVLITAMPSAPSNRWRLSRYSRGCIYSFIRWLTLCLPQPIHRKMLEGAVAGTRASQLNDLGLSTAHKIPQQPAVQVRSRGIVPASSRTQHKLCVLFTPAHGSPEGRNRVMAWTFHASARTEEA